jgi:hypothetical protein
MLFVLRFRPDERNNDIKVRKRYALYSFSKLTFKLRIQWLTSFALGHPGILLTRNGSLLHLGNLKPDAPPPLMKLPCKLT